MYCSLLVCTQFAQTSVVAERDGALVGAVTGFVAPDRDDTLFIWQVAVSEAARGQSLGRRMLEHLLTRPACESVSFLETTVTASNGASWAMFEGFARRQGAGVQRRTAFDEEVHFNGEHETEFLARIGPLMGLGKGLPAVQQRHQREIKL